PSTRAGLVFMMRVGPVASGVLGYQEMARRHERLVARALVCAAPGLLAMAPGCHCHDAKPYTPYKLGDGPAQASASGTSPQVATSADAGAFAAIEGAAAPGDGKSWPLGGEITVAAPVGRTFGTGLVFDANGDGKPDLVAWAKSGDGLRGELVFAS